MILFSDAAFADALYLLCKGVVFPDQESWVGYSCLLMPVLLIGAKGQAKRYRPVERS